VKLSNTFEIDRPVGDVFDIFLDIERVAACMPGSRLTGRVDDQTYEGEVKIKVGPLTVAYAGQATFVEIDKEGRQLTLRARARETRGAGNADALIVARLEEHGSGTRVVIDTDLSIRGKVAQFGRGAIGEVAARLMQQFAQNVEVMLSGDGDAAAAAPTAGLARPARSEIRDASPAEDTDKDRAPLDGWALFVVPLARKALPTAIGVVLSGVASYVGARIAIGRATRRS